MQVKEYSNCALRHCEERSNLSFHHRLLRFSQIQKPLNTVYTFANVSTINLLVFNKMNREKNVVL
jgi:hypothetical protein